ncbi:MAG TPA: nucleoside phosphorylase [Parafilimonas sp.]
MYIPESELVLNNRRAIYHLNLLPEELAQTIITVGDPDRVQQVSKHFDLIEIKQQHREFISHTGLVGKKRITVLSTGIGTDNIDIVLNELDALVNIDFDSRTIKSQLQSLNIIRIGTCGSLRKDIPVDSFIASTHALGIDNLLNYYVHDNNEEEKNILQHFINHTQITGQSSQPYIAAASTSLLKNFVHGFHNGITVTCPGFYGPQGRVLRLGLSFPNLVDTFTEFRYGNYHIVNFEMETSAIYGLGKLLGHHCLSLSTVVANRVSKQFSKNAVESIEKLIKRTLELIESI